MVQNVIASAEKLLNVVDRVPFFGSFPGMIRILAGMVQTIAGIIFAYLKSIYLALTYSSFKIKEAIEEGTVHFIHGLANIMRGAIAMLPVVNLSLAFYDYKLGRYNYPDEKMEQGVYPIATAKFLAH